MKNKETKKLNNFNKLSFLFIYLVIMKNVFVLCVLQILTVIRKLLKNKNNIYLNISYYI